MTAQDIRSVLIEELGNIAPEAEFDALDPAADLREALDIDSMDFLNFITAVDKRLGFPVPEADYPKLFTLEGAVEYLEMKLAGASS
jgi:acyl carrier protein